MLLSAKIDPKACDKGVIVFQFANMATEVCRKSNGKWAYYTITPLSQAIGSLVRADRIQYQYQCQCLREGEGREHLQRGLVISSDFQPYKKRS